MYQTNPAVHFRRLCEWLIVGAGLILMFVGIAPSELGAQENRQTTEKLPSSNSGASGRPGGSAQADFDSLIDLIESTVAADSWAENGTGEGQVEPFPNGVFVDALRSLNISHASSASVALSAVPADSQDRNVRTTSPMRFVSLPRLEAAIHQRQQLHQPLAPEMLTLAGLQRIKYVLIFPESGDLVLAGPAGDWQAERDGRLLSMETGQPVLRLDDLLTLWRRRQTHDTAAFGCSINPRQQSLARTQAYVQTSNSQPIETSERQAWLTGLRESLGRQDVQFFGIDAHNHVSRVLLLADYHMKLIGMGLADGVAGVGSYLDTVELLSDGSAPPMSVLRWWFAMDYPPVEATAARTCYRLRGPGVRVLSENELLAARGERIHTFQSDELNRRFADSFTKQFQAICAKYPLYGELRNVFDLALALAVIEEEDLAARVGWQAERFSSAGALRLPRMETPGELETVVSHRVINRRHILAGVSGGVWIDAQKSLVMENMSRATSVSQEKKSPPPVDEAQQEMWWWDEAQTSSQR